MNNEKKSLEEILWDSINPDCQNIHKSLTKQGVYNWRKAALLVRDAVLQEHKAITDALREECRQKGLLIQDLRTTEQAIRERVLAELPKVAYVPLEHGETIDSECIVIQSSGIVAANLHRHGEVYGPTHSRMFRRIRPAVHTDAPVEASPPQHGEATPVCRVCARLSRVVKMVRGKAIPEAVVNMGDGQHSIGTHVKNAPLVDVWKCPDCGHSFTADTPAPWTIPASPEPVEGKDSRHLVEQLRGKSWGDMIPVALQFDLELKNISRERDEARAQIDILISANGDLTRKVVSAEARITELEAGIKALLTTNKSTETQE